MLVTAYSWTSLMGFLAMYYHIESKLGVFFFFYFTLIVILKKVVLFTATVFFWDNFFFNIYSYNKYEPFYLNKKTYFFKKMNKWKKLELES